MAIWDSERNSWLCRYVLSTLTKDWCGRRVWKAGTNYEDASEVSGNGGLLCMWVSM